MSPDCEHGLLKRWITSLPVHGSVADPDFQRGGGGGGGDVARSQKIWALKVRGSPCLDPPLWIIRRNGDLNITGRRRQRKRR